MRERVERSVRRRYLIEQRHRTLIEDLRARNVDELTIAGLVDDAERERVRDLVGLVEPDDE